jgi:hypothetical protein
MGTQGMSGQIGLTCDVNARILNPNGTVLAADACMEMSGFIDTKTLPTTGTYTIVVDPVKWAIGAVTLTLYDVPSNATGTVTIGGSPVAVPLSQGQNGTLTFTATAGQQVTVRMTSNTIGWTTIKLLKPDGTLVTQSSAKGGKRERARYSRYAKATFRKDRRLNIRLSSKDLEAIQKRALAEGLPYQTLISSLLHKYASGRLKEVRVGPSVIATATNPQECNGVRQ